MLTSNDHVAFWGNELGQTDNKLKGQCDVWGYKVGFGNL